MKPVKISSSMKRYTVRFDGGVWHIEGKPWPGEFRVYRVEGDVNRLDVLAEGIRWMLRDGGADAACRIVMEV